jgi:hypothetical protein
VRVRFACLDLHLKVHSHNDATVGKVRIVAFRPIWLSLFMKDPASFLQLMSTALEHRKTQGEFNQEERVIKYRHMAWNSVNERLSNPALRATDGIMSAILAFLIRDVSLPIRVLVVPLSDTANVRAYSIG